MLEAAGVAADRIDAFVFPTEAMPEFGAGGTARGSAGNLRANRRVMIRFRRQAATLPVGP